MIFGANDLFIEAILYILASHEFATILILFCQVASPESLNLSNLLIKA